MGVRKADLSHCHGIKRDASGWTPFWLDGRRCSACGALRPDVAIAALQAGEIFHQDGPSGLYFIGDELVDFAHFGDGHRMKFTRLLERRRIFIPPDGPPPALPQFMVGAG